MVISCLLDNVSLTNNPEKKVCVFADEYSLIVLIHLFAFHFFLHVLKKKEEEKVRGTGICSASIDGTQDVRISLIPLQAMKQVVGLSRWRMYIGHK